MFKLFIHTILAFTISFSTSGFWINNHYCQDKLVETSLYFGFENCCAAEAGSHCAGKASDICDAENTGCKKNDHDEKDGCCDNKSSFHKLDQKQEIQKTKFKPFKNLTNWNTIFAFNIKLQKHDKHALQYHNYKPPIIHLDQQARLQVFLC